MLEAVAHCHRHHVCHRDLKPENFLFSSVEDNATLKLIDFGLSKVVPTGDSLMKTRVGTPYYMSPELLRGEYTTSTDVWSVGVMCYVLLCGYPPFNGDNDAGIYEQTTCGPLYFDPLEWGSVSGPAKAFVTTLLNRGSLCSALLSCTLHCTALLCRAVMCSAVLYCLSCAV